MSVTRGIRTLGVWCPDWPVVAAGVEPGVPAAVVHANRVVACSGAARAEGVRRGLRRREAQARCPELVVLEHDPGRDARAFEPVVAAVEAAVCPRVEIVRPGVCAFATRGPSRYFGGDEELAATVAGVAGAAVAGVLRVGTGGRDGTGPVSPAPGGGAGTTLRAPVDGAGIRRTPGDPPGPLPRSAGGGAGSLLPAAGSLPPGPGSLPLSAGDRAGRGDGADGRRPLLAEVGCRVGVADGRFAALLAARRAVVVPPGESRAFLAPFPVAVLDRPELADLLVRLGVPTLGALAALPPVQVLARFGPEGAVAHGLARGLDDRPLAARTPPPDLAAQAELDPPAERVDTAAFVAKSLADQLHADLARRGLACTRIVIEAETDHGELLTRVWRHDGALTAGGIAERVRWQLDGWLDAGASARPTAGISLLRLVPDEVRPDDGAQGGFWGGTTLNDERAGRALARVQGMLGPEAVVTAVVGGGRGPAERVRLVPWGDARASSPRERGERPPWPGNVPPPAPAVVHPEPLPTEVVDAAGRPVAVAGRGLVSAPPARLGAEEVVAWAGPWPVDERWWDPPAHRRRARMQLLTAAGTAHLVAVEGGRWWVEATYD